MPNNKHDDKGKFEFNFLNDVYILGNSALYASLTISFFVVSIMFLTQERSVPDDEIKNILSIFGVALYFFVFFIVSIVFTVPSVVIFGCVIHFIIIKFSKNYHKYHYYAASVFSSFLIALVSYLEVLPTHIDFISENKNLFVSWSIPSALISTAFFLRFKYNENILKFGVLISCLISTILGFYLSLYLFDYF